MGRAALDYTAAEPTIRSFLFEELDITYLTELDCPSLNNLYHRLDWKSPAQDDADEVRQKTLLVKWILRKFPHLRNPRQDMSTKSFINRSLQCRADAPVRVSCSAAAPKQHGAAQVAPSYDKPLKPSFHIPQPPSKPLSAAVTSTMQSAKDGIFAKQEDTDTSTSCSHGGFVFMLPEQGKSPHMQQPRKSSRITATAALDSAGDMFSDHGASAHYIEDMISDDDTYSHHCAEDMVSDDDNFSRSAEASARPTPSPSRATTASMSEKPIVEISRPMVATDSDSVHESRLLCESPRGDDVVLPLPSPPTLITHHGMIRGPEFGSAKPTASPLEKHVGSSATTRVSSPQARATSGSKDYTPPGLAGVCRSMLPSLNTAWLKVTDSVESGDLDQSILGAAEVTTMLVRAKLMLPELLNGGEGADEEDPA